MRRHGVLGVGLSWGWRLVNRKGKNHIPFFFVGGSLAVVLVSRVAHSLQDSLYELVLVVLCFRRSAAFKGNMFMKSFTAFG